MIPALLGIYIPLVQLMWKIMAQFMPQLVNCWLLMVSILRECTSTFLICRERMLAGTEKLLPVEIDR
jgi:hypothetical protein